MHGRLCIGHGSRDACAKKRDVWYVPWLLFVLCEKLTMVDGKIVIETENEMGNDVDVFKKLLLFLIWFDH